jgi:hypothetical protein
MVKTPQYTSISARLAPVGIAVEDTTMLAAVVFSLPRGYKEVDLRLP